jgi:hypothetical protein
MNLLPLLALLATGCVPKLPQAIAPFTPGGVGTTTEGAKPAPEEDCGWVARADGYSSTRLYYCCPNDGLTPRCVEATFIDLKAKTDSR